MTMDREPGDWYGVNSIAQVIKNIFKRRNAMEIAQVEYEIAENINLKRKQQGC
jgi:hypothetical protein